MLLCVCAAQAAATFDGLGKWWENIMWQADSKLIRRRMRRLARATPHATKHVNIALMPAAHSREIFSHKVSKRG